MKRSNIVTDYGIDALKSEGYSRFKEYLNKENNEGSLITKPWIYIPLAIGLSFVDGIVIYGLTNISMQQNALMGYLMAFTLALVLNVVPLIMGQYIHHVIYRTRKYSLVAAVACLLIFVATYATTINLRYQYKDLYGEGSVDRIVNQVDIEDETDNEVENETPKDNKALAVFWLLAIEPLATSIMNLFLGLMGDNSMKKRIYSLKMRQIELYEAKSDCEAAIADMDLDVERIINIDYEKSLIMKEKIHALQSSLKAVARQILAEELGDPTSISKLCGDGADYDDNYQLTRTTKEINHQVDIARDVLQSISA